MTTLFHLSLFSLLALSFSSPQSQTYIVLTKPNLKPSVSPTFHHWYTSTLNALPNQSDEPSPTILHTYTNTMHGFSTTLTQIQASLLKSKPFVLSVLPDRVHHLQTTRSPQFLGLSYPDSDAALQSEAGNGVIIAFLDTGITPTHRSFRDDGLAKIPPKWKGSCQSGDQFPPESCNKKLIGAKFFPAGFKAAASAANITTAKDIMSPLDTDGHGTHTASTAAGRPSPNSSFSTLASGTASGMAPGAHIAAYKVCWSAGCFDSDVIAAIDQAVADGAHIISLSIGAAPTPFHLDPIAIASFAAASSGVLVSASAGNDGPGEMTVANVAPWIATVGAGSIDRDFPADVVLGNGDVVRGTSLYVGPGDSTFYPLVYAGNVSAGKPGMSSAAPFCIRGTLDPALAHGKVVMCESGAVRQVEKGLAVKEAGGAGMIVANHRISGNSVVPDAHLIPAAAVGADAGYGLRAYMLREKDPRVRFLFKGTRLDVRPAPVVAAFSGRGPNAESDYVIKPDLIAPGVAILAAWTDRTSPTRLEQDLRRIEFNVLSGTSMSCPHVSGIAALVKAVHPDWSPAAVKSALMTTASLVDNLGGFIGDESLNNGSIVMAMGSGYVNAKKCIDPGLVYDTTVDEYVQFLCSSNYSRKDMHTITRRPVNCSGDSKTGPWDLNYPSISVLVEQDEEIRRNEVMVRRVVTNVGEGPVEYTVHVEPPKGAMVEIQPTKLLFKQKGEKLGFVARIEAENVPGIKSGSSRMESGSVIWTDGKHEVRSPIAVTWRQN